MSLDRMLEEIKCIPGFADHVGMLLSHEGIVRSWSRDKGKAVSAVRVEVDQSLIEELRREFESYPGIFKVAIETEEGLMYPGDELLRLVVAGDIRENVIPALSELLDRMKGEVIHKEESPV